MSARILIVGTLPSAPVPPFHGTTIHFLNAITWTLADRLGNTREKYPEQQQHGKLESQTPLHNTSLEAANILNKVTAHI